jgi:hypothetical protein
MSRAKLTSSQGTVEFGVVSEERSDYVADITEYPIEGGNQISDHAALRPVTLAIDGVVAGPTAAGVLATVRSWQENRLLVTYSGRGTYRDFVIKEFRPTEDVEVGDGFRFAMALQEVRIVSPATILRVKRDPALPEIVADQQTAAQVQPVAVKGRDQPQSAPMGLPAGMIGSIDALKSVFGRGPKWSDIWEAL